MTSSEGESDSIKKTGDFPRDQPRGGPPGAPPRVPGGYALGYPPRILPLRFFRSSARFRFWLLEGDSDGQVEAEKAARAPEGTNAIPTHGLGGPKGQQGGGHSLRTWPLASNLARNLTPPDDPRTIARLPPKNNPWNAPGPPHPTRDHPQTL